MRAFRGSRGTDLRRHRGTRNNMAAIRQEARDLAGMQIPLRAQKPLIRQAIMRTQLEVEFPKSFWPIRENTAGSSIRWPEIKAEAQRRLEHLERLLDA